jgi:hypothetical protein
MSQHCVLKESTTLQHETSKKPKKRNSEEKRLARWRSSPSQNTLDRIERALSQRMYLIARKPSDPKQPLLRDFVVLGSVGNVYNVSICHTPTCECPDFRKGYICKHILFIFLKVLRVPQTSPLVYQKALLSNELKDIFDNAPKDPTEDVLADDAVREKYQEVTGENVTHLQSKKRKQSDIRRLVLPGELCPICYDEMNEKEDLVWCETQCGRNVHRNCFEQWANQKQSCQETVTCVYCRAKWPIHKRQSQNSSGVTIREGYLNLGDYQPDIDTVRDTSTYRCSSRLGWRYHYYNNDDDDDDGDRRESEEVE